MALTAETHTSVITDANSIASPGNVLKRSEANGATQLLLFVLALSGIGLAFYTETWVICLTMSISAFTIYLLIKTFSPALTVYGVSISLGLLSAQVAFQMKDNPHFVIAFFIAAAGLVFYNQWKVLMPITVIFVAYQIIYYFLVVRDTSLAVSLTTVTVYIILFLIQITASAILLHRLQYLYFKAITVNEQFQIQTSNLQRNINYAKQIASGNFDSTYEASDDDALGQSLLEMSRNLKTAAEENKNRNWTMAGIARIAEIIRVSNHKMEDLANQIVSYLVKYLNATQGGIFVINDSNPDHKFLELKGCYAYDRKKYLEKRVELGEGLLGQSILERDTVYLKVVPQDYLNITSGLGQANPKTLIIVPLKTEEEVVGALEIASFHEFPEYQREFLEKVSENIASSIIFTKSQDQTKKLLEDSQVLAEQLRAQEEEMRQNMEELQATQEDLQRKNVEMENAQKELTKEKYLMEALMKSTTDNIYFKDLKSRFIRISNSLASAFGTNNPADVVGKSDFDFFTEEHARPAYEGEQEIIRTGKPIIDLVEKETWEDGRETYVSTSKMPLRDLSGKIIGTFGISRDVTNTKRMEFELIKKEKLYHLILKHSAEIFTTLDSNGKIKYQSPSYFELLQLEEKDLTGIKFLTLIHPEDVSNLEKAIADISQSSHKMTEATFRLKDYSGEWRPMKATLQNFLSEEDINSIIIISKEA